MKRTSYRAALLGLPAPARARVRKDASLKNQPPQLVSLTDAGGSKLIGMAKAKARQAFRQRHFRDAQRWCSVHDAAVLARIRS